MREFLRKNGKIIMTILSVALMFIFALPAVNKNPANAGGEARAYLNGKKISRNTLAEYENELRLLRDLRLLPPPQAPFMSREYASTLFPQTALAIQNVEEEDQAAYWMLLCQEAGQYSQTFVTFDQAASLTAENYTSSYYMLFGSPRPFTPGNVLSELGTFGMNAEHFVKIFQRLDGVESYLRRLVDVPKPVAQLELLGDRAIRKVLVTFTAIDGKSGWETAVTPTDAEIASQFSAYKAQLATALPKEPRTFSDGAYDYRIADTERGAKVTITERGTGKIVYDNLWSLEAAKNAGVSDELMARVLNLAGPPAQPPEINGHHYPFGYKIPDRVQVEWLVLKRADIRAKTPHGKEDDILAMRFVQNNPGRVKEMLAAEAARKAATQPATAPATQPDTATAPATQSAAATSPATTSATAATVAAGTQTAPATRPQTPEELFVQARSLLMDMQLDTQVDTATRHMIEQITTRAAPWKNGVAPAPSAWVSYDTLAKTIAENPEFHGYTPEHGNSGRLMSAVELAELPGIGDSFATVAQQLVPFNMAATSVKEVATLDKDSLLSRLGLQVGAEGPIVHDAAGNLYIYRVVGTEKSHEPANVDETVKPGVTVKSLVIDDLKKLKTYERHSREAKELVANGGDITAVAAPFKARVHMPEAFSRLEAERHELPLDVAGIRGFPDKAFALQPGADGKGVTVFDDEEQLNIDALSLAKFLDATGADFAKSRMSWLVAPDPKVGMVGQDQYGSVYVVPNELTRDYLSIEALAARLKYVPVDGFKKKKP